MIRTLSFCRPIANGGGGIRLHTCLPNATLVLADAARGLCRWLGGHVDDERDRGGT